MNLQHENIVVGSNLNAVIYAFVNNYPIFYTAAQRPFRFDYLNKKLNLDFLKIPKQQKKLNCFNTELTAGIPKFILWERLLFLMSIKGLVPLSNICKNIRHSDGKVIFSNDYSKILEVKFDTCHYFGDDNANGFIKRNKLDELTYLCYDYIAFNSGGKHEVDLIHTDDDFVSEIWFYSSDRIDGNTPVRDACAVSKLTSEQLNDFDFSETMARFKALKVMKDYGMRGKQNGFTPSGKPRHYNFKTSSIRREIRSCQDRPKPANSCIKIQELCEKDLLRSLKSSTKPYDTILGFLNEQ